MNFFKQKRYYSLFLTLLLAFFFTIPSISAAAGLVPCGTTENPEPCTLCDLVVGVHGIMEWGFGIIIAIGIFIITIAGIMYMISSGNTGMIDSAKSAIKNVVIGMVVVLGAWLIINYGMKLLGVKEEIRGSWYQGNFTCNPGLQVGPGDPVIFPTTGTNSYTLAEVGCEGSCGQGGQGQCCPIGEIENEGIASGEFELNIMTESFTHLAGGGCSYPPSRCWAEKRDVGEYCGGERREIDGTGAEVLKQDLTGTCATSCPSINRIEKDDNFFNYEIMNFGSDYPVCKNGLYCCTPASSSVPSTPTATVPAVTASETNTIPIINPATGISIGQIQFGTNSTSGAVTVVSNSLNYTPPATPVPFSWQDMMKPGYDQAILDSVSIRFGTTDFATTRAIASTDFTKAEAIAKSIPAVNMAIQVLIDQGKTAEANALKADLISRMVKLERDSAGGVEIFDRTKIES